MEPPLRICTVKMEHFLYPDKNISLNEVINFQPTFEGGLGFALQFFVDVVWYRSINYTLTLTDSFGSDGCRGSIYRNESDIALVWLTILSKKIMKK